MSTSAQKSLAVVVPADGDKVRNQSPAASVGECSKAASLDLESGSPETKPPSGKSDGECRICHLSLDGADGEECSTDNATIELGCSCKDDLAAAHRKCAETWFKIRGNRVCEICGSIAYNVSRNCNVEPSREDEAAAVSPPLNLIPVRPSIWLGHRFLNFVLACVIFAFVISWLFHFNVPS